MSLPNGFLRTKLKSSSEMTKLLTKLNGILAKKKNAFNLEFRGLKMEGVDMTNVDLLTSPTAITFTHGGVDYSLEKANIVYFKRLRTRKYMFKTNVLTVIP